MRVIEGAENLSARTQIELDMSRSRNWDPTIRLACQCYVKGDVKIQRLIWSSAEVNRLQKETAPEGKAEERPIAILFCDLRNFTALSAQNATFDIAYFLNRFYTALGDPILLNNGIIYQYVGDEIKAVVEAANGLPVKVILECHYLNDDEIRKGCELCVAANVAFVKTGTGWAPSGATPENIALMKSCVGDAIRVKAAGGVRDLATLAELYRRGARRFGLGLKSAINIFDECAELPGGILEL